jgi:hypothetical protein
MRRPDETINRNEAPEAKGRRRSSKFIPFIMIGIFVAFILSQEVPGFRHAIDYYIANDKWQASETCSQKALQMSKTPDFMRIIEYGDVHKTENGFFIENIIVGEMAEQGGEQRFSVDCYTDAAGNLVRADRRQ